MVLIWNCWFLLLRGTRVKTGEVWEVSVTCPKINWSFGLVESSSMATSRLVSRFLLLSMRPRARRPWPILMVLILALLRLRSI